MCGTHAGEKRQQKTWKMHQCCIESVTSPCISQTHFCSSVRGLLTEPEKPASTRLSRTIAKITKGEADWGGGGGTESVTHIVMTVLAVNGTLTIDPHPCKSSPNAEESQFSLHYLQRGKLRERQEGIRGCVCKCADVGQIGQSLRRRVAYVSQLSMHQNA